MNRAAEFTFDGENYRVSRVIGDWGCAGRGPTLVFVGSLHGNEPTGVVALTRLFDELQQQNIELQGRVLGLTGNLQALSEKRRFIHQDLNRIWTRRRLRQQLPDSESSETREQNELNRILDELLQADGTRYFFDLHTTSSPSSPFVAINDQMANRDFAAHFPVSTIFGIEEYLHGPLLSYLNDYGHVAFAFEAGQHDDPVSARIHYIFIKLALYHAGLVPAGDFVDPEELTRELASHSHEGHAFFEVVHREPIEVDDHFVMHQGFANFKPIRKGEPLAIRNQRKIRSRFNAQIFMPLYQKEGTDGFFVIRRIPRWAIGLSRFLRNINFDRLLTWLPGVSRLVNNPETLVVNKRVAFLLRNQLFHLLGYRRKQDTGTHVMFTRREIVD